ncbi:acyl-CoA dehydrogenase family protein [Pseudonocardia lacus]|uniref:acyl-CoA dehydrogenase family protein n=1 Tax=Pseudonocardia lacus TaxID=2835865 RepID=UPI001BDD80CF|nr:acyl-CoA dehydrogenase family protein [Pseudonocardia lacus]
MTSTTTAGTASSAGTEDVEAFRLRVRAFLAASLPRKDERSGPVSMAEAKQLQAVLFDGGFAGIAFPARYGGAGLTLEHQTVFGQEAAGYRMPTPLAVSVAMLAPTLLDHGSEELKSTHLPRILRGDEIWLQLLSEPSGGSDMAGVLTRAVRSGEQWVVNGAKIWTTGANHADYGMCLARTDPDVPKHAGLSMFAVPLAHDGVRIEPIVASDGGTPHFFQEFLDDVELPAGNLIGELNNGWVVARALLYHERNATAGVGHGRGYRAEADAGAATGTGIDDLIDLARAAGTTGDPVARQLLAEAHVAAVVARQVGDRVMTGIRTGAFRGDWGSLLKLGMGIDAPRRGEIGLAVGGTGAVVWDDGADDGAHDDVDRHSVKWLTARTISIAGGTNEMQRNIVSERLLGMPREASDDRTVPFRELLSRRTAGS